MPVDAVYLWLLTPVLFCCTRGYGCNAHPAFPAPSLLERVVRSNNSDACVPRERRVTPLSAVMLRESGASSTPRPLGLSTSASGILDPPRKPGEAPGES